MKIKDFMDFNFKNFLLILGVVFSYLIGLTNTVLFGRIVDILGASNSFGKKIAIYLGLFLIVNIISGISSIVLKQFLPLSMSLKKTIGYSDRIISGVFKLNQKDYAKREKGYFINLVTSSSFTYGDVYLQLNVELIANIIYVVTLLAFAFYINIYFFILLMFFIPIYYILTKKPSENISNFQKNGLSKQDKFLSSIKSVVEDKRSINIIGANQFFYENYTKISKDYLGFITKFKWYSIVANNIPLLLSGVLQALTLILASYLYFNGYLSLGSCMIMFQVAGYMQEPLNRWFGVLIYFSINKPHLERLNEFYDMEKRKSGFEKLYKKKDNLVELKDACFFTEGNKSRKLFQTDKLSIDKNSLTLIKGGNGSGKSMFVNYLTGFSDVKAFSGDIEIDESLSHVSYLSYPILTVEGSLEDNMFGKEMDRDLLKVLNINFDGKTIDAAGETLSFGEKQKLNLLRVLSSKENVIVLDEPFSNLDKETIASLSAYLESLKGKKTVIAIVHSNDLDSIADNIYTIHDQKISLTASKRI